MLLANVLRIITFSQNNMFSISLDFNDSKNPKAKNS